MSGPQNVPKLDFQWQFSNFSCRFLNPNIFFFPIWILIHTASFWNIIIQLTSHNDLTEKLVSLVSSAKLVKWQNIRLHFVIWQKNCLCLTSLDDQIFKSFWKPNPWMNLLEKKILLYQFLFYFLQVKSFPPWMACFNSNINDLDFVTKEKLKLVKIVANWGHSR